MSDEEADGNRGLHARRFPADHHSGEQLVQRWPNRRGGGRARAPGPGSPAAAVLEQAEDIQARRRLCGRCALRQYWQVRANPDSLFSSICIHVLRHCLDVP